MANQSHELNSVARERAASNRAPTIANLPAVVPPSTLAPRSAPSTPPSTHQCPNCGAWAPTGSSVCAECGGRIQPKPQKIRCRLCGARATATLVLCPDCGRELHPAPSRVLSWGAPTILVVLFLLIMVQRWESGNPFRWLQTQVATSRAWVSRVAERLDPQIEISTLPEAVTERGQVTAGTNDSSALTTGVQSDTAETTLVANPNTLSAPEQLPSSTQVDSTAQAGTGQGDNAGAIGTNSTLAGSVIDSIVVTPTATATASPSPQPTDTATAAAPSPTATVQPTVQATPTAIVEATATPRQTSTSAIVQTAPKKDTDAVAAADLNARKAATTTVTILQPTPTTVPTQTATPTQTAVPTQAAVTYAIRAGDTPFGIATQFDISVNELLAANGLSLNDARRLRVGQVLTIVTGDAPAAEQPTPTATATATTQSTTANAAPPAAANAAPPAVSSTARVDAPVQRSPENGSFLSCGADNTVTWLPVAYIRESDQYLLHLGFLSGYNGDGSEQVTWILEQWRPSNVTQWDLDTGLCGLAPQAFGRQWRWSVEVVEASGNGWQPVSPSSAVWGFSWN